MARWHGLWMTPAHTPEVEREINIERLVTIARHQPLSAAAHSIVSLILAVTLFDAAPMTIVVCQILIQAVAGTQLAIWWRHRHLLRPSRASDRTMNRMFAWSLMWGALWGVYAGSLMAAAPEAARAPISVAVVGMAAGAMNMLAGLPAACAAFLTLTVVPPALVAMSGGRFMDVVLGVCLLLAGVFLGLSGRRTYLSFLEHLRLRLGISHLADEAEAASRAKSRFLAHMSHELRTPLNAIIGFAEMIHHQVKGPVPAHYIDFARAIDDSGRHLVEIINDILDLSKIQAGSHDLDESVVSLATVIDRAATVIRPVCQNAQLTLEIDVASDLPQVYLDARRFNQVLINLLSNAAKFSRPSTTIRIEAFMGPPRAGSAGGPVIVRVIDQGTGIPADELQEVLKPFVQSRDAERRQVPGTGLGLPLADQIMRLHGGTLALASVPGEGTTVTLTIPPERVVEVRQAMTVNREIAG